MKEEDKNPQDEISGEEINKLPEEFRVTIVYMIQNLEIRVEKRQELFNSNHLNTFKKDLKEIKYKQW